jgi:tetratricopeptide (TPR) repeat protein
LFLFNLLKKVGMKPSHLTNAKKPPFLFFTFFLCGFVFGACASPAERREGGDFQRLYKEYQGYARAGYAAINKKAYIKAIEHYSKAIEVSPFEPSHYYYRGLAWYKKGNKKKAIEDFDKVIILDSRWRSAYIYRGLCLVKSGEYGKALSDYKKALNLKHDDAAIHNNLAWLYATAKDEKFKDNAKALEHAKKAAELSKERNAEILDTLARAYYINGKVKEAIETEKKALKLHPGNESFKEKLEEYQRRWSGGVLE